MTHIRNERANELLRDTSPHIFESVTATGSSKMFDDGSEAIVEHRSIEFWQDINSRASVDYLRSRKDPALFPRDDVLVYMASVNDGSATDNDVDLATSAFQELSPPSGALGGDDLSSESGEGPDAVPGEPICIRSPDKKRTKSEVCPLWYFKDLGLREKMINRMESLMGESAELSPLLRWIVKFSKILNEERKWTTEDLMKLSDQMRVELAAGLATCGYSLDDTNFGNVPSTETDLFVMLHYAPKTSRQIRGSGRNGDKYDLMDYKKSGCIRVIRTVAQSMNREAGRAKSVTEQRLWGDDDTVTFWDQVCLPSVASVHADTQS